MFFLPIFVRADCQNAGQALSTHLNKVQIKHAIKSEQEKKKKGKAQIGIEALATEKTCTVHSIAKYDEICALFLFRFEKGIPKVVGDNFFPRTNSKSNKRKTACALVYRKQNMYIFDNVR